MARVIKPQRGYVRRMTMRGQVQALWISACVLSGSVAQFLVNLH